MPEIALWESRIMADISKSTKEFKKIHVPFKITKALAEDKEYFHFEGYASTFGNIDRDGDIIEKGAFLNSIDKLIQNDEKLPILWHHNMNMPLGIYIHLGEDEKGLFVRGRMPKSDTFVSGRAIPQMEIGSVSKMSIGFFVVDSEWKKMGSKSVRLITEGELIEISPVSIPSNTEADITATKAAVPYSDLPLAPRQREWDKDNALARVRKATDSLEKPGTKYKKAFFWFDENAEELFGSYKLPFVDIIDGELKAVPRGIFAVAAALRGARGGVNIPEEDKNKIIDNVNRYYEKMRREFNDDNIISPLEQDIKGIIKNITKLSDMEKLLRNNNYCSKKESQMIISKIAELKAGEHPMDSSGQSDSDNAEMYQDIMTSLSKLKKELSNGCNTKTDFQ
jgi:HK97 family phage prohead protease